MISRHNRSMASSVLDPRPGMTSAQASADSRGTMKRLRARWFWGVLFLCVVAAVFCWPRRMKIPLSDGTTLEIAEITTGKEHSYSPQWTWRNLRRQFVRRTWKWPVESAQYAKPSTVFWFEDARVFPKYEPLLVDRNGWRWGSATVTVSDACHMDFPAIESDGPLRVEIVDGKTRQRIGDATIPASGVRPDAGRSRSIEAPSFPIRRTDGPLSASIRGLEVQLADGVPSQARGRIRCDILWNNRPFTPEAVRVDITDSLGRESWRILDDPQEEFFTHLSPYDINWDITLSIFRGIDMPLDPDETFVFEPVLTKALPVTTWDGSVKGTGWRVIVANPGQFRVPFHYHSAPLTLDEGAAVIAVELESNRNVMVRIEPLDSEGNLLSVETVEPREASPHVQLVRCPGFAPAKRHTIRVGFNVARHVNFSVRPEVLDETGR